MTLPISLRVFALCALLIPAAVSAQDESGGAEKRTRIFLGPQIQPAWPGAKKMAFRPYADISRAPEGTPFEFEAPDESAGLSIVRARGFEFGPTVGFIGKRSAADIGADLPKVGFSAEAGGFAQVELTPSIRLRLEGRKGLTGHKGWVGEASADYIARRGDDWLFSIGPRVTFGDGRYHRAWFGVAPDVAARTGLTPFSPGGGVQSVGVTAGLLYQFDARWGVAAFAGYQRLVGDAAASPVTRAFGTRSQPSAGIALSHSFGGAR
jgi:outer membrane protein